MRRIAGIITIVLMVFVGIFGTTVSASEVQQNNEFDINSDGVVNVYDMIIIRRRIIEGNSNYNVADAVRLKKFLICEEKNESVCDKAICHFVCNQLNVTKEQSDEIMMIIGKKDCEISIKSKNNDYIVVVEDETSINELVFAECTGKIPNDATVICNFYTIDGEQYVIYVDSENTYKLSKNVSIGPAIVGIRVNTCNDETNQELEEIFAKNELISVSRDSEKNITFYFADSISNPSSEVVITFDATTIQAYKRGDTLLQTKKIKKENSTAVCKLYSNGWSYSVTITE